MNTYRILYTCSLVLMLIISSSASCIKDDYHQQLLTREINAFSARFYQTLAKNVEGNFISSPISAFVALAMTAYGSAGNTYKELENTLQLPFNRAVVGCNLYEFVQNLKNAKNADLRLANGLFIHSGISVRRPYASLMQRLFQSDVQRINFDDSSKAVEIINNWCQQKTNNTIREIVTPDNLSGTQLLIINAVYFKGDWVTAFDKVLIDKTFCLSKNHCVSVPTMYALEVAYNYGSVLDSTATYVELPYKSDDDENGFSMYVILPNKDKTVDEIGNNIDNIDFSQLGSSKTTLNLYMPKFKLESKLDLKPFLQKMGIRKLFKNNANLSNINHRVKLKVQDVYQKASINVDTKGSEAAVTTAVSFSARMLRTSIGVDRPFIFAIVSKISGTPIFWGRVMDPRT